MSKAMYKKLFYLFIFLSTLVISKIAFVNEAYAQCSGTGTGCYTEWGCDTSGLVAQCENLGTRCMTQACTPQSGGVCGWTAWVNNSCAVNATGTGCILGSGAPFGIICSSPPPPLPPPSSPPSGGSCTGSGGCQGGISNCGQIGRQDASGTCPSGQICCGDLISGGSSGTFRCDAEIVGSDVPAGGTATFSILYGDQGSVGNRSSTYIGVPSPLRLFATNSPESTDGSPALQRCGTQSGYSYGSIQNVLGRWCTTVYGLNPGSARIDGTIYGQRCPTCSTEVMCSASYNFTVTGNNQPTVNLLANGTDGSVTISSGSSATLSWTTTGATSCTASGGWSGSRPTSGSEDTGSLSSSTTYTLTCDGPGGTAVDTVNVNVGGGTLPTVTLRGRYGLQPWQTGSINVFPGGRPTLNWIVSNATSNCTSYSNPPVLYWNGELKNRFGGTQTIGPVNSDTLLGLTCTGPGGQASDYLFVNVLTGPPPPSSCSLSLVSNPSSPEVGQGGTLFATVTNSGGTVTQVQFSVTSGSSVTIVSPSSGVDDTPPSPFSADYTTSATSQSTVEAVATMDTGTTCSDTITITPSTPGPWWQVTGGEVISRGTIRSLIPLSCALDATCQEFLILPKPVSGRPSTAICGLDYDFSNGASKGSVSPSGEWLVQTDTKASTYTYGFFRNRASGKVFTNLSSPNQITTSTISSADDTSPQNGGYAWIQAYGNASLGEPGGSSVVNINKRAVIFVDGDLTIHDRVRLVDPEDDFLMVVVSGDINVHPDLVSPDVNTAAIQGIFVADGTFATGTNGADDGILVIEGSVAAGGIRLERGLTDENTSTPGEHFIYSPALIVNYPSALAERHLVWREVAP